MSGAFDYVNNILYGKTENMMRNTENDKLAEKGYVPWQTNLALALYPDTILVANMMNQYHYLDNRPQYEFYKYAVRPMKRKRAKWVKSTEDKVLDMVCEHYSCNRNIAKEYLNLLSEDQLEAIKKEQEQGG